ncbi:serralysin family metalloprotease [Serratia sp. OS31]|nr:serralysin family metalloprotease [Serratia sp. OS31]
MKEIIARLIELNDIVVSSCKNDDFNSVTVTGKPSLTSVDAAHQIVRTGLTWNGNNVFHKAANITFSFPEFYFSSYTPGKNETGLSQFTNIQKNMAKLSIQAWSDVADITFLEVSAVQRSNITFGNYSLQADGKTPAYSQAYAYLPGGGGASGQTWYNYNMNNIQRPDLYEYGRQTLSHELGHALGLSHPGSYNAGNGNPTYDKNAVYAEDTRMYSIMSYWSEKYTGGDHQGHYSFAPLLHDITAIQYLYGANMSTRLDDTVYGFNSNTGRDFLSTNSSEKKLIFSVWDAGGNDTFDFSGYGNSQHININEEKFSDVGGLKGNVSIAKGVIIENVIGGYGNDVIIGNDSVNILKGGRGNDVIFGGGGGDELYGGEGKDVFLYYFSKESTQSRYDWIRDFQTGIDKIDISYLNKKLDGEIRFVELSSDKKGDASIKYEPSNDITTLSLNMGWEPNFILKIVGAVNTETDFFI